jgi:hypothetical protein
MNRKDISIKVLFYIAQTSSRQNVVRYLKSEGMLTTVLSTQSLSAATLFGYAPEEPVGDRQDQIQHALGKIQKLVSNFKRMAGNAHTDGNKLLQAHKVQSSDPEGLLALVTETKLAITQTAPAGVDISSCVSGNDQKYQAMVQEAGR